MKLHMKLLPFAALPAIVMMAMPALVAAATTDTTISSVVGSSISINSIGTVNLNVTPTSSGVQTIDKDTVTVSTNDVNGYTLKLNAQTTNTNLVSGANTIAASSATPAAPTALTAGKWGYRVDGAASFGAGPTSTVSNAAIGATTFAGVPASNGTAATLKTTASTATNDTTNVWYSVAANDTQPTGTYAQIVTYTVTAN